MTSIGRATAGFLGLLFCCSVSLAQYPTTGLRDLEEGVKVGTVVSYYDFRFRWDDGRFLPAMKREYSIVTASNFEWAAPWDEKPLRPARDVFDFTINDATVAYIENAGLEVRGHALLHANWPPGSDSALPAWLTQGNWTRDQAIAILREHIQTVVGRYRGRISRWAVVNEAIQTDGTFLDCYWLRKIGPEYIELAFRFAHEADPDAFLYINEDGAEAVTRNSDALYALVNDFIHRGVPIHGVGLEMHLDLQYLALGGGNTPQLPASVRTNLERFAALGIEVEITEMDVRVPIPVTQTSLAAQARIYGEILAACQSVRGCTGFTTWGFTDRYSWIPGAFPGLGAALPFDANVEPKPAYFALRNKLANGRFGDDIQKVYVAYYGRPADPGGQEYWASQMDGSAGSLNAIIGAFGNSKEFNGRYGALSFTDLVTKIYQQTLSRNADPAGLAYYVGELQAGRRTLQSITLDVLNGATTAPDATVVANKLDVSAYYTSKVAMGCPYGIEQDGVNSIASVTANPATVTAAKAAIDTRCGT